jgi:hypothetical protein
VAAIGVARRLELARLFEKETHKLTLIRAGEFLACDPAKSRIKEPYHPFCTTMFISTVLHNNIIFTLRYY